MLSRLRWPLVVLLVSIGLTALAAIEAQRAVRSQRAIAQRALREYASFAAWSYAQHLTDGLSALEREAIGAVNHGDNMHTYPKVPTAQSLAQYLPWSEACGCHSAKAGPNPETFFAIRVGHPTLDVAVNRFPRPTEGWFHERHAGIELEISPEMVYAPDERRWIVDSLTRRVRQLGEIDHGFNLVVGRVDQAPKIIAYTLMPTSWGDTMVYGARYSREAFVRILASVLDGNGLLPATFTAGRRNRDILAVRVRSATGDTLYDSAPGVASDLDGHVDLPRRAGLLSIDASIRPDVAGSLLVGGLPRSRLPFLLGLLALAAALSIVAVTQLRREGELARLRAGFVSSVSHELRTPVAQIRLYLDTLRLGRASTDEQRAWTLGHLERETTRLSHLVENVLRFSTLGGDDPTQREPTDVRAGALAIVEEFRPLAASKKATLEVAGGDTTSLVSLRPDALRHILLNLLDNAVKYGPAGQTIRVTVDDDGSNVAITVDDEGPGVPPRDRERIWRPFTRGATARESGGSGIGLTVVQEVVHAHGGTIVVTDAPSKGARFVVTLPLADSDAGRV